MSRIYHNEPLQSIPVTSHDWPGQWSPSSYQVGKGILLEGKIQDRQRHVISCQSNKERYCVLVIKVSQAHCRKFDSSGKEIEPNFSTTTVESTGYLHSSYKKVAKGETDAISEVELRKLVEKPELTKITGATAGGTIAFWILEAQLESIELGQNDAVRMKTKGDSPFVENITKVDSISASVGNYAGAGPVGLSWTQKVMNVKMQQEELANPAETGDGAADEDWVSTGYVKTCF